MKRHGVFDKGGDGGMEKRMVNGDDTGDVGMETGSSIFKYSCAVSVTGKVLEKLYAQEKNCCQMKGVFYQRR